METLLAHEKISPSLKEFKLETLPIVRAITRNNVLWPSHRAGPMAMLSSALRKGSRDLHHVPRAGL